MYGAWTEKKFWYIENLCEKIQISPHFLVHQNLIMYQILRSIFTVIFVETAGKRVSKCIVSIIKLTDEVGTKTQTEKETNQHCDSVLKNGEQMENSHKKDSNENRKRKKDNLTEERPEKKKKNRGKNIIK